MPTQDELAGLYDTSKSRQSACARNHDADIHVATELIDITCLALLGHPRRIVPLQASSISLRAGGALFPVKRPQHTSAPGAC